jgi:adenine-specific DNA-methyltransferase
LAAPRYSANFDAKEKVVVRQTGDCIIATLDEKQFVCMKNMHVINTMDTDYNLKYILALLNSKVLDFYYQFLNPEKGEALAEVKKENVAKLPIKPLSLALQQPFIAKVEAIISLKAIGENTADLENEIDAMVYALYDLTAAEVAVVEGR